MGAHKMQGGWRDIPDLILKRGQYVKYKAGLIGRRPLEHGHAYGSHKLRALAISDELLETFGRLRLRQRRLRGRCCDRTGRGRGRASFQEASLTREFRGHCLSVRPC